MKRITILLAMLLACGLLYASGSQGTGDKQEPVTVRLITYWNAADSFTPYYEEVAAKMLTDFPHLTLNNEGYESAAARDKYAVEFASGSPPDLTQVPQNVVREYVKQGLLLDIYPFVKADPEWEDSYTEGVWDAYATGGKMYMSPMGTNYGSMMYNKNVLAKAGLSGPALEWDDLLTYVKKIRSSGVDPWLTGGKEYRWAWLVAQIMQRTAGNDKMTEMAVGSEITGWDKPENGFIHAMELLEELVKAEAFPEDVNALPRNVGYGIFTKDGGGIWYEGSWMINSFTKASGDPNWDRDNLMIGPFPKVPGAAGDQVGGVSGPLGLAVSHKVSGEQQRLALELVKRLASPVLFTKQLEESSRVSMIKVLPDADWSKVSPILQEQLKYYQTLEKVVGPNDVFFAPAVDNAIKKVAAPAIADGSMTPKQAAAEVNRRAMAYFNK